MLNGVPAGGCPPGYKLNAAANDCDGDPDSNVFSNPRGGKPEVVVVRAKPPRVIKDWDWKSFWGGIALPGVIAPPPRVIDEPRYIPPPSPVPFWKTTAGIVLIAAAVGAIIVLTRGKK